MDRLQEDICRYMIPTTHISTCTLPCWMCKLIEVKGLCGRAIPICQEPAFGIKMTKNHQTTVLLREKMGPQGVRRSRKNAIEHGNYYIV